MERDEGGGGKGGAVVLYSGLYVGLNIIFNFYSKYLFQHRKFDFPALIMLFHQTGVYLTLKLMFLSGAVAPLKPGRALSLVWPTVIIGTVFGFNIILNNASLVFIPLSLNQCIKCNGPLLVMLFAYFLEGKKSRCKVYTAGIFTVAGAVLSVYHNPGSNTTGVTLAVLSLIFASLQTSLTAYILQGTSGIVAHLTMQSALVVSFWCIPMVAHYELEGFHRYAAKHSMSKCLTFLFAGLVLALTYGLVTNKFSAVAGSVFCTIVGNVKLVVIIFLSAHVFHEELAMINYLGIVTSVLAFAAYSYFKHADGEWASTDEKGGGLFSVFDADDASSEFSNASSKDEEDTPLLGAVTDFEGVPTITNRRPDFKSLQERQRKTERTIVVIELALAFWLVLVVYSFLTIPNNNLLLAPISDRNPMPVRSTSTRVAHNITTRLAGSNHTRKDNQTFLGRTRRL